MIDSAVPLPRTTRWSQNLFMVRPFAAESNPDHPDVMGDTRKDLLTVLQAEDVIIDDKTNLNYTVQLCHAYAGHMPMGPLQQEIQACQKIKSAGTHHKTHFRVVFAELGTPIFNLKSLGDVLETLEHALEGLPSLFSYFTSPSPLLLQDCSSCTRLVGFIVILVLEMCCALVIKGRLWT